MNDDVIAALGAGDEKGRLGALWKVTNKRTTHYNTIHNQSAHQQTQERKTMHRDQESQLKLIFSSVPIDNDSRMYLHELIDNSSTLTSDEIVSDVQSCLEGSPIDPSVLAAILTKVRRATSSEDTLDTALTDEEIEALIREDAEKDDDGDDGGGDGGKNQEMEEERFVFRRRGFCSLCHCPNRLSVHHMVPRLILKRNKNHGKTKINVSKHLVELCSPCHHELHRLWGHRQLSNDCDTVDKILAAEEMQSYLTWKRKKERSTADFE